ncbi:hypothetical protein H3T96_14630, partial [Gilliamella sp. W8136]
NPRAIGPYYAYNDRYLEIRGGMFENFRGIVTWLSILIFMFPLTGFYFAFIIASQLYNSENENIASDIFAMICFLITSLVLIYLCFRYFRYVYRLELFTVRHIRVRFNRVTRQV